MGNIETKAVKCRHCGKQIQNVLVNFFNFEFEGADADVPCPIKVMDNDAVEIEVDRNWTGYDLSEEEQMDTISCPYCKKFPFVDKEIYTFESVQLVMFAREISTAPEGV